MNIEDIAAKLRLDGPDPFSFLVSKDLLSETVFFARHRRSHPHEPMSATVKLIQGIYAVQPEFARKVVRNRIFSTDAPTEMCLAMVKVAAKNFSFVNLNEISDTASTGLLYNWVEIFLPENFQNYSSENQISEFQKNSSQSHSFWMRAANDYAESKRSKNDFERPLFERDRQIAALLVSQEGELLASAINSNSSNRTLHAEVNLLQSFYKKTENGLPAGARIYSTLKPCKMCAGMIWHATSAQKNSSPISVFYGRFDPGTNGRSTVLDVASFERKRACSAPFQCKNVLQFDLSPDDKDE